MLLRILLAVDALAAAIILYFFAIGLNDGSVSSFNGGLWVATLAGLAIILGGSFVLNRKGRRKAATALLLVLAIPAALFAIFVLVVLIAQPRWN